MKKNGFTLIELIAVIAILGLMGILVSPAVLKIRENSLKNSLKGKISLIKSAAVEFASDNLMNLTASVPTNSSEQQCNSECINRNGNLNHPDVPSSCSSFNCDKYCNSIMVRRLIEEGYIAGDSENKNELTNPLSDVSLNYTEVCITFDKYTTDRKITVYIKNESNLFN